MWLFRQYVTDPVGAVIEANVALPTKTFKSEERCSTLFSTNVNYLSKRFTTEDNIATVDADILSLKQVCLTLSNYIE